VVVGAGVVGASVAYHLAARGVRRVVVLERESRPGLGSTGRATGGFRVQYGSPTHVRLSLLAREELLAFRATTGVDPGYRPCGYLFLARTEEEMEPLRRALAVQREAGVRESRVVGADEIRTMAPWVRSDDLVGGTFCSLDGFIRPLEILRGYLEASRRLGVEVRCGVGWVDCRVEERAGGRRVVGVRAAGGDIAARCVVNATGPWAGVFARRAGLEVPVEPARRQVAVTAPCSQVPEDAPMTICSWDGLHLRVRDGRVLLLWPADLPGEDPFDTTFSDRWLAALLPKVHDRFPCLREVPVDRSRCLAGLYEMSPDRHALLGPAPGLPGLYLANGSSGHGVMHAPALGRLLAELIVDGRCLSLDIRPLRPSRFAEGDPNPEDTLL
jgi:sarcosine oxidase subunit beta